MTHPLVQRVMEAIDRPTPNWGDELENIARCAVVAALNELIAEANEHAKDREWEDSSDDHPLTVFDDEYAMYHSVGDQAASWLLQKLEAMNDAAD